MFLHGYLSIEFNHVFSFYREPTEVFDPSEFPDSYKENVPKEKLVLQYNENFRRQYVHLYRDRKPLFLNPVNECGIEVNIVYLLLMICSSCQTPGYEITCYCFQHLYIAPICMTVCMYLF